MSNELTSAEASQQSAVPVGDAVTNQLMHNMAPAIEYAKMISQCSFLPADLHNNVGNCFMIVNQAMTWGMNPFSVAQCVSNIRGKLMFEGKLVGAAINSCPKLKGSLNYKYAGEGQSKKCTCFGTFKGEDEPREITITLKDVKSNNEQWNKNPDQMLSYFAARVWARRHMPEVMLGVYSPDEFDEKDQAAKPTQRQASTSKKQPPTENPKVTKQKQLTDAFVDKVHSFKNEPEFSDWLAQDGPKNFLGELEKNHQNLARQANDAIQSKFDHLHTQEGEAA